MTDYTDNRRYPFPSSAREAGNGALHSELLARAVAADLDVLDAGWSLQSGRPTKITGLSSNFGPLVVNTRLNVTTNTVIDVVQPSYFSASVNQIQVLVDGWYWANLNIRAAPASTVTVNARLQNWLRHMRANGAGLLVNVEPTGERFGDTYWPSSTADAFNKIGGMFRALAGDVFRIELQHSNTGSNVNVVVAGTYLEVTRMMGL